MIQFNRKGIAQNEDAWSLGELVLYGLKGMAAYADHARILGVEDDKVSGGGNATTSHLSC